MSPISFDAFSSAPGADWFNVSTITTADETSGPALNLANDSSGDEEGAQKDDNGVTDALTKEFKGQRWDADKSVWK